MAFSSIPDSLIQVGKAITRTLFKTYIKDSLDDLDSRINTIEGSASKIIIFDDLVRNAATLVNSSTITGIAYYRVGSSISLTDCKIGIFTKRSLTGNLRVDIKKSSSLDFSSAVSVFTTQPEIDYGTASNYDESANAVFDNVNKDLQDGDYIRFDVTSLPSDDALGNFTIYLIAEPS